MKVSSPITVTKRLYSASLKFKYMHPAYELGHSFTTEYL